jgi:hypothetical protein
VLDGVVQAAGVVHDGQRAVEALIIWGRPQGSKREGISMKSEAA